MTAIGIVLIAYGVFAAGIFVHRSIADHRGAVWMEIAALYNRTEAYEFRIGAIEHEVDQWGDGLTRREHLRRTGRWPAAQEWRGREGLR